MSCSVHDLVRLEKRDVATAGVGTEPFVDEALEQASILGMPALRMTLIPHPVQLLSEEEITSLADATLGEIVARVTQPADD